ncbi:hypothetical protein ACFOW4_03900 [Micromonospora sp. GCM10011542]|uniref:hypothetical protein n=1 Tax=Micromonospora sp. GCM10011542 TaxID=3317337 RepID=UPI003612886C
MKRRSLSPLRLLLAGLAAVAMVLTTQVPAHAEPTSQSVWVEWLYSNGVEAGRGQFQADPFGSEPGDALRACDFNADGYGIEVRMMINPSTSPSSWRTDRMASTRGINSPYCTPWATGNLTEGTFVGVKICLVKGTFSDCKAPEYGWA